MGRDGFSIPDRHANINPASRAQFLASPASRRTVKSRIPSIYLSFSRFPHRILVESESRKYPSRPSCINTDSNVQTVATLFKTALKVELFSCFDGRPVRARKKILAVKIGKINFWIRNHWSVLTETRSHELANLVSHYCFAFASDRLRKTWLHESKVSWDNRRLTRPLFVIR